MRYSTSIFLLVAGAVTFSIGCESEPTATRQQMEDRVKLATTQAVDSNAIAMRSMYGTWTVDVDATVSRNTQLPEREREAVRRDLMMYPFDLQITSREYISYSRVQTRKDRYTVERVDGGIVIIALTAADGVELPQGRKSVLRIEGDKLLIGPEGNLVCVMSRSRSDGG